MGIHEVGHFKCVYITKVIHKSNSITHTSQLWYVHKPPTKKRHNIYEHSSSATTWTKFSHPKDGGSKFILSASINLSYTVWEHTRPSFEQHPLWKLAMYLWFKGLKPLPYFTATIIFPGEIYFHKCVWQTIYSRTVITSVMEEMSLLTSKFLVSSVKTLMWIIQSCK